MEHGVFHPQGEAFLPELDGLLVPFPRLVEQAEIIPRLDGSRAEIPQDGRQYVGGGGMVREDPVGRFRFRPAPELLRQLPAAEAVVIESGMVHEEGVGVTGRRLDHPQGVGIVSRFLIDRGHGQDVVGFLQEDPPEFAPGAGRVFPPFLQEE